MAKPVLMAAVVVLSLLSLAAGCSKAAPTTTDTVKSSVTTTTSATVAVASSTTSTTQPVVWQTISYEQNTPGLDFSGGWTYSEAASASKGSFVYSDSKGASLTFHFVGTYCGWLAKTSEAYGKAAVIVDDGTPITVDLYSKDTVWRHLIWQTKGLSYGYHTVRIEWTGKKQLVAKGACVDVDALEIVGALVGLYEQNNARFEYSGTWKTSKNGSASGGSFTLTNASPSSVTVNFTGIQLDWLAKKGPAYGEAEVIVDDAAPVTVDLYGAHEAWAQTVWSTGRLAMGAHMVSIRWTGLKSAAATGTYINVDAFEIAGAAQ